MKTTKITFEADRWERADNVICLSISHDKDKSYTTVVGPFDLEDLKELRKQVRKEIKRMENENH